MLRRWFGVWRELKWSSAGLGLNSLPLMAFPHPETLGLLALSRYLWRCWQILKIHSPLHRTALPGILCVASHNSWTGLKWAWICKPPRMRTEYIGAPSACQFKSFRCHYSLRASYLLAGGKLKWNEPGGCWPLVGGTPGLLQRAKWQNEPLTMEWGPSYTLLSGWFICWLGEAISAGVAVCFFSPGHPNW